MNTRDQLIGEGYYEISKPLTISGLISVLDVCPYNTKVKVLCEEENKIESFSLKKMRVEEKGDERVIVITFKSSSQKKEGCSALKLRNICDDYYPSRFSPDNRIFFESVESKEVYELRAFKYLNGKSLAAPVLLLVVGDSEE